MRVLAGWLAGSGSVAFSCCTCMLPAVRLPLPWPPLSVSVSVFASRRQQQLSSHYALHFVLRFHAVQAWQQLHAPPPPTAAAVLFLPRHSNTLPTNIAVLRCNSVLNIHHLLLLAVVSSAQLNSMAWCRTILVMC